MTRTEFVSDYATRSGLSNQWAMLGIVEVGDKTLFALPCGCEDDCPGWAMVSANTALDHLRLHAPKDLRAAYNAELMKSEKYLNHERWPQTIAPLPPSKDD